MRRFVFHPSTFASTLVAIGVLMLFTLSTGQSNWTWRKPIPQGNTLRSVIWAGNQAVAVGNKGSVVTSPDGKTWTKQVSIDTNILLSVTWTGSQLVAVGDKGIVFTSPSGTVWTKRNSGIQNQLSSVTWTGTQLVAVGPNDALTSPDGVTWTTRAHGNYLNSVIWADTQLVAVGWGGRVSTSPDGITWTTRSTPATEELYSVTWTGSQFIAVGYNGTIITSANALTWKKQTSPTTNAFHSVTWTGKLAVAAGLSPVAYTSPDGMTWSHTPDTSGGYDSYSVVWNGRQAIEVGQAGMISASPTGETWTNLTGNNEETIVTGTWTGREYVALSGLGTTYASLDGFSWTKNPPRNEFRFLKSVTWTDSLLVAVGMFGQLYTSSDAVTWTPQFIPTKKGLNAVTWGGSKVVAVGDSGSIITSADGVRWTAPSSGTLGSLGSVIWDGKQFLVYGSAGNPLTSPDGEIWTSHSGAGGGGFSSVAWNGIQFVGVGGSFGSATLATSPDGLTWTDRDAAGAHRLTSVAWVHNQFIAVDDVGNLITSTDGVTWIRTNNVTDNSLSFVGSMGDLILVGGNWGTLLSAPLDAKVAAPRLVSPLGGALDLPISNLPLTWTRSTSATTFHVQVSTNSLFTNILFQDSTLTDITLSVSGLTKFKTYYWRVRAKNSDGVSAWTAFRRFRTLPPPPPIPVLKSPLDGATNVQQPMTLQWSPVNTAYDYRVQISADSNFTSPLAKDTLTTDSLCLVNGLAFTTSYYWRVQSKNTTDTSAWSPSRHFITSIAPPAAPALTAPPQLASNQLRPLLCAWNKVPEAASYHLVILYDTIPWPIFLEDSSLTDTQKVVTGLGENTGFYWRVQAKNSGGVSAWSPSWHFGTIALPQPPKLFFPFKDVDDIPDSLPLVWYKSLNAIAYHVQLATDTGFTHLFMQDSAVTDTGHFARGKPNGTYYWRVRGKNAGGWGAYSQRWMFKTSTTTSIHPASEPRAFRIAFSNGNVQYTLPERCHVSLRYFDMHGVMVQTLVNAEQGPGDYGYSLPANRFEKGMFIREFRAGKEWIKNKVIMLR